MFTKGNLLSSRIEIGDSGKIVGVEGYHTTIGSLGRERIFTIGLLKQDLLNIRVTGGVS
jgi:hypothetical protein